MLGVLGVLGEGCGSAEVAEPCARHTQIQKTPQMSAAGVRDDDVIWGPLPAGRVGVAFWPYAEWR